MDVLNNHKTLSFPGDKRERQGAIVGIEVPMNTKTYYGLNLKSWVMSLYLCIILEQFYFYFLGIFVLKLTPLNSHIWILLNWSYSTDLINPTPSKNLENHET